MLESELWGEEGMVTLVLVGLSEEVTFELGPFKNKGKPGLQKYWD